MIKIEGRIKESLSKFRFNFKSLRISFVALFAVDNQIAEFVMVLYSFEGDADASIKSLLEFSEQKHAEIYGARLAEIKQRLDDMPSAIPSRLVVLPCLEYLMVTVYM